MSSRWRFERMRLLWSRHVGFIEECFFILIWINPGRQRQETKNKHKHFQTSPIFNIVLKSLFFVFWFLEIGLVWKCFSVAFLVLFNVLCSDDGKEHCRQDWLRVANYTWKELCKSMKGPMRLACPIVRPSQRMSLYSFQINQGLSSEEDVGRGWTHFTA